MLSAGTRPAGNWVAAAVPFFRDLTVAAVVAPTVAPLQATARGRCRGGGHSSRGSAAARAVRVFPGNVRGVSIIRRTTSSCDAPTTQPRRTPAWTGVAAGVARAAASGTVGVHAGHVRLRGARARLLAPSARDHQARAGPGWRSACERRRQSERGDIALCFRPLVQ